MVTFSPGRPSRWVLLVGVALLFSRPAFGLGATEAAVIDSSRAPTESDDEPLPAFVLDVFEVQGERPPLVTRTVVSPTLWTLPPVADGGDFLRLLPGVTGGRMGGHGIEPVIRGQQQTQLNVIVDGAFLYGGCPNRMDPPSAISNFDTADRITVVRGKQSVVEGAGGPGGTVLIEHLPPVFAFGHRLTGRVSPGYESNGAGLPAWADLAVRDRDLYLRGTARRRNMEDYTAGDGTTVRSAFDQYGGGLSLGWSADLAGRPDADFVELSAEVDRTDDALFAGSGMDSPRSDSWAARWRARRRVAWGPVSALRADAYVSNVDHEMDNFTLRPRDAGFRRAITESRTWGGRALAELNPASWALTVGADFQRQLKNADRFGNNTDRTEVTAVQSILWPDVALGQIGLFAEGRTAVASRLHLIAGLRYDRIDFTFARADEAPTLPTMEKLRSPNDLYRAFYGVTAEDVSENNLGGLARLEYEASASLVLSLGLSRTLRTADPTERALASEMGPTSWVGNPALRPEKHHQLDFGLSLIRSAWRGGLSLYVDRIDDYVFRDAARDQADILVSLPQADVYRNLDVALAGAELEAGWTPNAGWRIDLDGVFTWGENLERDGPLAQIPPLQGHLSARRALGRGEAGARINAAARQTRVDLDPLTGSGRDLRETPGYVTLDLFGRLSWRSDLSLRAGITNVLDRVYANHLNRENGVDNEALQVYEPGRSFYLRMVATF